MMNLTAAEVEAAIKAADRMRKDTGCLWITVFADNENAWSCSKDDKLRYG